MKEKEKGNILEHHKYMIVQKHMICLLFQKRHKNVIQ